MRVVARVAIWFGTTVIMLIISLLGIMWVVAKGPSITASDLFVVSVRETSAIGFLANLYFSEDEIQDIISRNSLVKTTEITDASMITIQNPSEENAQQQDPNAIEYQDDGDGLELIDIASSTYRGKLLIIDDPSRVIVGTSVGEEGTYDGEAGITVEQMAEEFGAIAGTNAGGFVDLGGVGNGGTPLGIVISQGELKYGSKASTYEIVGITNDNILVVGTMTGQEALDMGVRDCVYFENSTLIVNGNPLAVDGLGSGLNPRTAIGQTADGKMLLLVIDGRQANSLGATLQDLIDIMLEYGAVNAANLDGGSSSNMVYDGEVITMCSSIYGPRKLPTSILVLQ